jgi:hypothetical protein
MGNSKSSATDEGLPPLSIQHPSPLLASSCNLNEHLDEQEDGWLVMNEAADPASALPISTQQSRRKWGWVWKSCGPLGIWESRFMVVSGNGSIFFFYKEVSETDAARIAHARSPLKVEGMRCKHHRLSGASIVRQRSLCVPANFSQAAMLLHPFLLHLTGGASSNGKVLRLAAPSPQESFQWALAVEQCVDGKSTDECNSELMWIRNSEQVLLSTLLAEEAPEDSMGTAMHECTICFDPLHAKDVAVLRKNGKRVCRHIYHVECLSRLQDKRCPICRAECDHFLTIPDITKDPLKWFQIADRKGDGRLSREEIAEMLLTQFPIDARNLDEHLPTLFKRWDLDNSGYIYYDELMHPEKGLFRELCMCRDFVDKKHGAMNVVSANFFRLVNLHQLCA